ncbi:hypothetical protein J9E33_002421 [Salmonella enterica]|uniref:hypothetical protein n=1 Tax=Salmonella enterica TaxID=28901 RepID=UPI0009AF2395|nr:hypothetical protein [Salmonella enterica]EBW2268485.1 hypothetical protein [Salmonella enterica subsp. enterica serovar Hillingdon]ECB6312638.1 hypothetical protein [Salmonella enterica subsp. enterica serovar Chailey]EDR0865607.1 hypothetical protein [Salmonella enterica subsp. enterica serovar Hillingdon]EDR6326899.1 hypothetical protein [Salmonella enterica subsp. enterica serovar Hillingdon]EFO5895359.1 hypothetical protein [Salmonella enterica]
MQMTPYTRDILRQYRAVINARRKAQDLSPLTTAQLLDSVCEFMTCQHMVYLCSCFIIQGGSGIPPQ